MLHCKIVYLSTENHIKNIHIAWVEFRVLNLKCGGTYSNQRALRGYSDLLPLKESIIILPRLIITPSPDNKCRKGIDIRLQKFTLYGNHNIYYDKALSRQQISEN